MDHIRKCNRNQKSMSMNKIPPGQLNRKIKQLLFIKICQCRQVLDYTFKSDGKPCSSLLLLLCTHLTPISLVIIHMHACPRTLFSQSPPIPRQDERNRNQNHRQKRQQTPTPLKPQIYKQLPPKKWKPSTKRIPHKSNPRQSTCRKLSIGILCISIALNL